MLNFTVIRLVNALILSFNADMLSLVSESGLLILVAKHSAVLCRVVGNCFVNGGWFGGLMANT